MSTASQVINFHRITWIIAILLLLPACVQAESNVLSGIVEELLRQEGDFNPITVRAGIRIHQITNVDQKQENFGIVASVILYWKDSQLDENLLDDGQQYKTFGPDIFTSLADEHNIRIPRFLIYNQQGRRHTQYAGWSVIKGGENLYVERFSVTLQAPDFNFRKYPFDRQKFFIHLDLLLPDSFFIFEPMDEYSGLGDELGEEEWVIVDTSSKSSISTDNTGLNSSRYSFGFTAERHINYYMIRIFLPILVITLVSWITFFLNDFRKRIDMASANLLIFIAFNFSISGNLPKLGYLTFMDSFMFIAFILTSFIILLNVIFRRIEVSGHVHIAHRIDSFLIWIYPAAIIAGLYWLSSTFLDKSWFFLP